MTNKITIPLLLITALILIFQTASGTGIAEGKIKNGKLLIKKALKANDQKKANYIYKAKREFDRAIAAEPGNPMPYYWEAVIVYHLENDSTEAAKLYRKALKHAGGNIDSYPAPWSYITDENMLAAFTGDFSWVGKTETEPAKPEKTPPKPVIAKASPLDSLSRLVNTGEYSSAESLYLELKSRVKLATNPRLYYLGLQLKLDQGQFARASDILMQMKKTAGKKSKLYKKALKKYDAVVDESIIEARQFKGRGQTDQARAALQQWEPERGNLKSPGRARLILYYGSLLLSEGETGKVDTLLTFYRSLGYKKNKKYKTLKKELARAIKQQEVKPEQEPQKPLAGIKNKPRTTSDFVTLFPPKGDIVKVIVDKVDPATGKTEASEIWETYTPLQLPTGKSYKLVIHKKSERKAPKYIAALGILTTLLIMR